MPAIPPSPPAPPPPPIPAPPIICIAFCIACGLVRRLRNCSDCRGKESLISDWWMVSIWSSRAHALPASSAGHRVPFAAAEGSWQSGFGGETPG